jgi:glutathione synthase/RimK-type ligase-like ATP-grasp enzyme
MLRRRLNDADANYLMLNQRNFAGSDVEFEVSRGVVTGHLTVGKHSYALEDFDAVYTRLMDDRSLPELADEPPGSALRTYCRGFHDALCRWMELTPALVVNRSIPMGSNASKPYQSQLIRQQGFSVPETLVTSNPELVREFHAKHGRVIYKSASAVRSIVQTLEAADLERLEHIRWCPTQFQAFVEGTNIRVHVIGDRVYPTAVSTEATDYRYAYRQAGEAAELREVVLSDELAARCVALTRSLGLVFAGVDLKVTPEDEVYCFEVNPSPAFSYYEANTGQPISEGLAACLMEAGRGRERHPEGAAAMAMNAA